MFFGGLLNSHKKLPPGQQSNIRMAPAALCARQAMAELLPLSKARPWPGIPRGSIGILAIP